MTTSRKAATEVGASMEASASPLEGPSRGELGWDRYRARRSTWRDVLSAVLAFALVAGVVLLVMIYKVGE
jgi:hypothetical protein